LLSGSPRDGEVIRSATPSIAAPESGDEGASFAGLRRCYPVLTPAVAVLPVALGLGAMIRGGRVLVWDAPLTDVAVAHRTPWLNDIALVASRLGSWVVVFPAAAVLIALAALRSRRLAGIMLVVVMARPGVEWLLKDLVGRPRPVGARLVPGTGFAYPSGHVLAAVATWGFVPPIVALYTRRRPLRRLAVAASATLIVAIAWSRVGLGVHWTSDVVGSLAIGFVVLSVAEATFERGRRRSSPPSAYAARNASTGSSEAARRAG
jgi:undecaprenyl-diphosphatase